MRKSFLTFHLVGLVLASWLGSAVVVWAQATTPTAPTENAATSITTTTSSDVSVLELNEKIKDKKAKISALKSQIYSYEQTIRAKQTETASLQNEMAIIDDRVAKAELDIQATEDEVAQIELEMIQVDLEIKEKEQAVDVQKQRLAEFVRETYQNDQKNILEILIMNDRFSDFYDQVKYLEQTQIQVNETLGKIKLLKDHLSAQRNGLDVSKQRQESLRTSLEELKAQLEEQKSAKQNMVVQSVMSANRFESLLDESRSEQSEIDSDIATLEKDVRQKLSVNSNGKVTFTWPVSPARGITAFFHDPSYPFRYVFEHPAIDIRAYQGTPVKAAESGYVARVKNAGMGYSYIMILHDQGLATVYGHLSALYAVQDTYVKKGQIIGLSGAAPGTPGAGSFTTGPHLHLEVRLNGIPVDPLKYLP